MIGSTVVGEDINDILKTINGSGVIQFSINPSQLTGSGYTLKDPIPLGKGFRVLHGKYNYNFCRHDVENQIQVLTKEVELASRMGCDVVIHQGKNVATEKLSRLEAIGNYVRNLTEVLERTYEQDSVCLLLENSAGQGTELGFTVDELAFIYHQFDDMARQRIGFCLDTCHAFVAGELDARHKDRIDHFLSQFEREIGLEHLKLIHFNDSSVAFGGRRDYHGDLLGGYITNPRLGGSQEGMMYLAQVAKERHIPLILETPCVLPEQYMFQFTIIDQWLNGVVCDDEVAQRVQEQIGAMLVATKTKTKKKT